MAIVDSNKLNFARSTLKKDKTFTINKLVSILECSSRTAQAKLNFKKTGLKRWNRFILYPDKRW